MVSQNLTQGVGHYRFPGVTTSYSNINSYWSWFWSWNRISKILNHQLKISQKNTATVMVTTNKKVGGGGGQLLLLQVKAFSFITTEI